MSKLILFDFDCPTHGLFEELVHPHVHEAPCPRCQTNARRQISPVRIDRLGLAMSGTASPESIRYFDKVHRERKAIEDRNYAEHGDYGHAAGAD